MSSFTLSLSGNSSELSASYYPPIELDRDGEYVCGLVDFQAFMSIPNVTEKNNRFCFLSEIHCDVVNKNTIARVKKGTKTPLLEQTVESETLLNCLHSELKSLSLDRKDVVSSSVKERDDGKVVAVFQYYSYITIPTGSYEIANILLYLSNAMVRKDTTTSLQIRANESTLKCELYCNRKIYFGPELGTIGSLLGFKDGSLEPEVFHISDKVINITSTNVVKFETNITTGAYSNGKLMRTLHEFYPTVDAGYKIVEVPQSVIYLPVSVRSIPNFIVRIVDQDDNLIDFRGENITLRVHIKRLPQK